MSYKIEFQDWLNRPLVVTSKVSSHETLAEAQEALATLKQKVRDSFPGTKIKSLSSPEGFTYYASGIENLTLGTYSILEEDE